MWYGEIWIDKRDSNVLLFMICYNKNVDIVKNILMYSQYILHWITIEQLICDLNPFYY